MYLFQDLCLFGFHAIFSYIITAKKSRNSIKWDCGNFLRTSRACAYSCLVRFWRMENSLPALLLEISGNTSSRQSGSRIGSTFPFRQHLQDLFLHLFPGFPPLLPSGQKLVVPGLRVTNMGSNGCP